MLIRFLQQNGRITTGIGAIEGGRILMTASTM